MDLIQDLRWRYATKRMNGVTVEQHKIDNILKAISLSPTSMGIEAYKVFVISDKNMIKQIYQNSASRQHQLDGCSHLLVFASYSKLTLEDVDKFLNLICSTREIPLETLNFNREMFINNILTMNDEQKLNWMVHQTYIAMGFALAMAANEKVDATPIEGFDSDALDKILDLEHKGLKSTLLVPLGYRDEQNDYLANAKKARKPEDQLFVYISLYNKKRLLRQNATFFCFISFSLHLASNNIDIDKRQNYKYQKTNKNCNPHPIDGF